MLQLLEVIIHHGEIKLLDGWQAVAFATRMLGGRVGHSTSTKSVNLFNLGQHRNERRCYLIRKVFFTFQSDDQVLRGSKRC